MSVLARVTWSNILEDGILQDDVPGKISVASMMNVVLFCSATVDFRLVRFEVFTAVTMKNGVFSDVTPCGSCKNRRFGGT
jgi:hypothetical protein